MFIVAMIVSGEAGGVSAQVPKLKGTDLVINGESFFGLSNIASELTRLAKADGVLPSNESFKQIAVPGAPIASIMGFYTNCNPKPKYLLSDGAGIDLMNGNCSNAECATIKNCTNTLLQYIDEMKKGGTKRLMWMVYPDPQGGNWTNLKKNQDIWAQVVPPIINGLEDPKGFIVDLRPVWQGHYDQYTTDGIHCTNAGGTASAEAFWKAMKADNWAFFDTGKVSVTENIIKNNQFAIKSMVRANGTMVVTLCLDKPSEVTVKLITISGRTVFTAKGTSITGEQIMEFNAGNICRGVYCCVVGAGANMCKSTVIVP
jgi:hypothetical protein